MGCFDGLHLSKPKLVFYIICALCFFSLFPYVSRWFGLSSDASLFRQTTKSSSLSYKRQFEVHSKIRECFPLSILINYSLGYHI